MAGLLAYMTVAEADKIRQDKGKVDLPDWIRGRADLVGRPVLGVAPPGKRWVVTLSATLAQIPKRGFMPRLNGVRAWPSGKGWELPQGVPISPTFSTDRFQILEEDGVVDACLLGASVVLLALGKVRALVDQSKRSPHVPASALENLAVVFPRGEPTVVLSRALRDSLSGGVETQREALLHFLRDVPENSVKGWRMEEVLHELLSLVEFDLKKVRLTSRTRDDGFDIEFSREDSLTGTTLHLAQVKNEARPASREAMSDFRQVCDQHGARGMFCALGGFSPEAARIAKLTPPIAMKGADEILALICPRLHLMTKTADALRKWHEHITSGTQWITPDEGTGRSGTGRLIAGGS